MQLRVIDKHEGEGRYPLFPQGTVVERMTPCKEYPHWCSCVMNGYEVYVPDVYVSDGRMNRDYNPTELVVEKDQFAELISIVFGWVYVKSESNEYGWLPAGKVVSSRRDVPSPVAADALSL